MTVFGIVRFLLGAFGALLVLQALFGVPYALSDGAWGPAMTALVGAVFGVWLVRVALNGTFSGEPPDAHSRDEDPVA